MCSLFYETCYNLDMHFELRNLRRNQVAPQNDKKIQNGSWVLYKKSSLFSIKTKNTPKPSNSSHYDKKTYNQKFRVSILVENIFQKELFYENKFILAENKSHQLFFYITSEIFYFLITFIS